MVVLTKNPDSSRGVDESGYRVGVVPGKLPTVTILLLPIVDCKGLIYE